MNVSVAVITELFGKGAAGLPVAVVRLPVLVTLSVTGVPFKVNLSEFWSTCAEEPSSNSTVILVSSGTEVCPGAGERDTILTGTLAGRSNAHLIAASKRSVASELYTPGAVLALKKNATFRPAVTVLLSASLAPWS